MEVGIPSRRQIKKVTQARLDHQDFIAAVGTIVKKETKKAVDAELEKKDRCQKFVEIAYGIGAWSTTSNDRTRTDITDDMTNRKGYAEMSEGEGLYLPP